MCLVVLLLLLLLFTVEAQKRGFSQGLDESNRYDTKL